MNSYDQAIWEVHTLFSKMGISYAVIGGVAVQNWGEPQFTLAIDLTVSALLEDLDGFVSQILANFSPRFENALDFALENSVILAETSNGYPLDIALGLPGYEDEVLKRVSQIELEAGKRINICSPEDLIIHKAIAGRPQDIRDIESIVYRQGTALDATYIRQWLTKFSIAVISQDISEHFEGPWKKVHKNNSLDHL